MLDTQIKFINVPGLNNSDDWHWQTLWEEQNPSSFVRVQQKDWENPEKESWVKALKNTIDSIQEPKVLIAHSLGCLTVVHYLQQYPFYENIIGILLVAPPDVERYKNTHFSSFLPIQKQRLGIKNIVVSSTNDPYCAIHRAEQMAFYWGSVFINIGQKGHINSESNLGEWKTGKDILRKLIFNNKIFV